MDWTLLGLAWNRVYGLPRAAMIVQPQNFRGLGGHEGVPGGEEVPKIRILIITKPEPP